MTIFELEKLGIYFETNYFKSKDKYWSQDVYINLFNDERFSDYDMIYLGKCQFQDKNNYYPISNLKAFFELEYYNSLLDLLIFFPAYYYRNYKEIIKFVQECDNILVMSPNPIAILILRYAKRNKKNVTLIVRQDGLKLIPSRFKGIKKAGAYIATYLLEKWIELFVKRNNSKVVCLGHIIHSKYTKFSERTLLYASSRYKFENIISESSFDKIEREKILKVLFVGRLEINKGLFELLRAIKLLKDFKIILSIVGEGTLREDLLYKIKEYEISDKVKLLGFIPFGENLLKVYKANQVLILPSYSEGLPQVIFEGMASGCIILSSSVGSVPSIIKTGESGFLFKPRSSRAIESAVRNLFIYNWDFEKIRIQGLIIAKKYAYENQIYRFIDFLNR